MLFLTLRPADVFFCEQVGNKIKRIKCQITCIATWYKKSQINRGAKASHFIVIVKYGQESVYYVRFIPSGWYA